MLGSLAHLALGSFDVPRRPGYFERASGGSLFLDEIGTAPSDVQVMLLPALETGQVQPVGAEESRAVDLRILSATDADLEAASEAGDFRAPLLHRLAGYEIVLPSLRERRDDVGRLFFHFLRQELAAIGEAVNDHARSLVLIAREVSGAGVRRATAGLHELMARLHERYGDDRG